MALHLILAMIPIAAFSQTSALPQHAADQDCEKIRQEIQALQDWLAAMSAIVQRLKQALDDLNKAIAKYQESIKSPIRGSVLSETYKGELLDILAKAMRTRKDLEQQLEDEANLTQLIKNEIADLLNKLGNCGPPSTTQPPKKEAPKEQPSPPAKPAPSPSQTSMSTTGAGVQFQLRGFGGTSIVTGNTPATAGFDGAVLFPLGNRVLVGPTAGFQWVNSSIVQTVGGGPPPSTFINTSVGFKQGNFGGQIGLNLSGFELGVHGGATAASSEITQTAGFCGGTTTGPTSTSPTGACTIVSSTTTHDTVVGPFVGGYISHSIFPHVGVFVEADYHHLKDGNVFDLNYADIHAGIVLSFGRRKAK